SPDLAIMGNKCSLKKSGVDNLHEKTVNDIRSDYESQILLLEDELNRVKNEKREEEINRHMEVTELRALVTTLEKQLVEKSITAKEDRKLSAGTVHRRILKSVHGTYLRANEPEWKVDFVDRPPQAWEHWFLEDWGGKIVLRGRGGPGKPTQFICAYPTGGVDLVGCAQGWEKWMPLKNENGSWSFLSAHGKWLSALDDGSVKTVDNRDGWEQFWLEDWE
ncbi:hypothetical protein PMAYCL1PPCAC_07661, partial [Pristionchus mayeri]